MKIISPMYQLVLYKLIIKVKIITSTLVSPLKFLIINIKITHLHHHPNNTNKESINPQQWLINNLHIFHHKMHIQRKKAHTVSIIMKAKLSNPKKFSKWSKNFHNFNWWLNKKIWESNSFKIPSWIICKVVGNGKKILSNKVKAVSRQK